MPRTATKIAVLSSLYVAQGLPYGFYSQALPLYLRDAKVSVEKIGFLSLLAAPWLLKFLWSPLVDRYHVPSLGRRRSWILPAQAALALTCAAGAFVPPSAISALLLLVFLMNLVAATQDIAVDGLAVDLLDPEELGWGNAAQVVGYKVGMIVGGGLLVWASRWIGWRGMFLGMAAIVAAAFAVILLFDERAATKDRAISAPDEDRVGLDDVLRTLVSALRSPTTRWLLIFLFTYKTGEVLSETMFGVFLRDAHIPTAQIALWRTSYGLAASILGSFAGGWLAARAPLSTAVWVTASGRVLPQAIQALIAATNHVTARAVIGSVCVEHLFGGALTTVVFAFMMSRTDRKIGATHYTVLACVEVAGKFPGGWISGLIAGRAGYAAAFTTGTILSVAFLALLPFILRTERTAPSTVVAR